MEKEKLLDLIFITALFLLIFLINLPLARLELMSPDASVYLDIGRNIFSSKGVVTSNNLNQFWVEKFHPALPYTQPVYPFIAGLLYYLFSSIKIIIGFNLFLLAANCLLLYKIIRLYTDYLTSFLAVFLIGFSQIPVFTAIYPWTEQLHLFSLLLAIRIYLTSAKPHFWVGIILGLSCLIRVAGVFNVIAFALALLLIKGFSKEAVREYLMLALGFLAIILTFEAFCFLKYGVFYPQYPTAAKTFGAAALYPGAFYQNSFPVLNMPALSIDNKDMFLNVLTHLIGFVNKFGSLKFALILVPLYLIFSRNNELKSLMIIFTFQGFIVIFGLSLSHHWQDEFEIGRFSLIPIIMLGSSGFIALKYFIFDYFAVNIKKVYSLMVMLLVVSALFFVEGKRYLEFRAYHLNEHLKTRSAFDSGKFEIYVWIKQNTKPDALIASSFYRDPFLFNRPFVTLPNGKALTKDNVISFVSIYQPDYVITANPILVMLLNEFGFSEAKRIGQLVLLSRRLG